MICPRRLIYEITDKDTAVAKNITVQDQVDSDANYV